ncbi:MAG: hypothetical protein JNM47_10770 [Hyphomonadaceae bacterium]|nr:hypothetical protein [Hyphomonadaceae bacterium]
MSVVTRREIVGGAAALSFADSQPSAALLNPSGLSADRVLAALWRHFLEADTRLAAAWEAVDRAQCGDGELAGGLVDRADVIGHEHDCIVRKIAARPAASWQGVTVKLLTWRRTANLSEFNLPDADVALAFSAYLDALRLSAVAGLPEDRAIARLALRDPDSVGEAP